MSDLEQLAIQRIKAASEMSLSHYKQPLVCAYSGGKDSDVMLTLFRRAGIPFEVINSHRDRLPKFRNGAQFDENGKTIRGTGHMVFNWFSWEKDGKEIPKIHPAQKPVSVIKKLIETFTDPGDVVIDPCCGSGSTLRAAADLGRSAFGFEIDRNFYQRAKDEMLVFERDNQISFEDIQGVIS